MESMSKANGWRDREGEGGRKTGEGELCIRSLQRNVNMISE